ncbi:phosphotransferase [Streptacidiphilus sp. ASG 303]|uniref:phosphotransferase n=1 Tax=Streptacidiphilus sp. ASG 303 TaxID=2896847 RepID=UPI0035AFB83C
MINGQHVDRPVRTRRLPRPSRPDPGPDAETAAPDAAGAAAALLAHHGAGEPLEVSPVAEGLLNHGYRVTATTGRYFLKCYVDPATATPGAIAAQHRATAALHALGLPTAPPLAAPGGRTFHTVAGRRYALFPWVEGGHRAGHELDREQCAALGSLLGAVHLALAGIHPPVRQPAEQPTADPARTEELIEELLARTARRPRDGMDELARQRLLERRALLGAYAHRRPRPGDAPPTGWVHGDFHPLNLLYRGTEPAAILDWDRLGLRPRAEEAVRGATLFFHHPRTGALDLGRVRRFSRAYRETGAADAAQMAAAVHRVWWERLNDFWMLEWRYLRGDRRTDPLFPAAAAQIVQWCEEYEQVMDAYTN